MLISRDIWYKISLSYATFYVRTQNSVVLEAAPIGKWMEGKSIGTVEKWVKKKGGSVNVTV